MSPLARSLLALAAAALLHGACAAPKEAGDQCSEVHVGTFNGLPLDLDYILPGQHDAVIDLSSPSRACLSGPPVGLRVFACDDVAPTLTPDWVQQRIRVTRNGLYCDRDASVIITLWCPL